MVPRTSLPFFPNEIQTSVQCRRQTCWSAHPDHRGGTMFWLKWPFTVHGQSALCFFFVGCINKPTVNSWSEATFWHLFLDRLSVMWTSTFTVLFISTDFVFCKSGFSAVFASSRHRVLLKVGIQDTLSYKEIKRGKKKNLLKKFL